MINKAYSRVIQNTTRFYTSDTALEIGFDLVELEYSFDSAVVILLNENDRSLVTRDLTRDGKGFTYELESDIIEHYGNWAAQLKLEKDGEIYISSPVGFSIENDLYNNRPPKLTDVNTWKNLRKIADGLISDIRSELELVAEQLLEIEGAETTRQQAETQRAAAESSRVSAEAQRKIDHANRSAELAGKADKVVLENLVDNGDFTTQINWVRQNSTIFHSNNKLTVTGDGTLDYPQVCQNRTRNSQHKYYVRAILEKIDSTIIEFRISTTTFGDSPIIKTVGADTEYILSGVIVNPGDFLRIYGRYPSGKSNGKSYAVSKVLEIDLTQTFGAGNEPTKEEMDELIKVTGYIDGEYALNNKDMLGHLMKGIREKADKKQEDWITPTLVNGATGDVQYRKNEFGVVEFRGSITATEGKNLMTLPEGYRLNVSTLFYLPPAGKQSSITFRNILLNSGMNLYYQQPYGESSVNFTGLRYVAER